MALTAPYEQKNYMGEFVNDAACLADVVARGWDSGGNPINGMWYYNNTSHEFKGYINGAWVTFDAGVGDEKVKVTSNDTTAGHLLAKLIGTSGKVTMTEVGDGGDEDLQVNIGADVFDKTADDLDDITTGTTNKHFTATHESWLDQDVSSGAPPTFNGVNISGIITGDVDQVHLLARKGTAGTIATGRPVYITGYDVVGGYVEVEEADASNPAKMPALGLADGSIIDTANGWVAIGGRLTGQNTSTYAIGDSLYVASGGGLTITKPTGTSLIQKMCEVLDVDASAGVVAIFGAGRSNDVPNLPDGEVWLGDGSGVPQKTALSTSVVVTDTSNFNGLLSASEDNAQKAFDILDDHSHSNAIHDNVSAEITAIANKAAPLAADHLLIEDSVVTDAKKEVTIGTLPLAGELGGTLANATVDDGADGTAIHDNVASEVSAIAGKTALVGGDMMIIEDSEASNAKKMALLSDINDVVIFGSRYQQAFTVGTIATTTIVATAQTLTTPVLPAGDYLISWYVEWNMSQISADYGNVSIIEDATTTVGQISQNSHDTQDWNSFSGFVHRTLTAAAHTFTMDIVRTGGAGTVTARKRTLMIWRVA